MPKQLSRKICIKILCEWEESSKFIDIAKRMADYNFVIDKKNNIVQKD